MKRFAYILFFLFVVPISFLPPKALYVISDLVYLLLYRIVGYRKKVVYQNISTSFPEKSHKEIKAIEKKFYKQLADVFIEYLIEMRISWKNYKKRFQYTNIEILDEYYAKGKDIVLVMGHYVNWEWTLGMSRETKYEYCPVYKKQKNEYFNKFLLKIRTRFDGSVVEMNEAFKYIYKNKKQNKRTLILLIADQRPAKNDMKYFTTFLNHKGTPVILGPERIAKSLDMAVMYLHMEKPKRGHFKATFVPLFDEVKDLPEHAATEAHVRALEKQIQEKPEYWLWSHKRWKITEADLKKETL